MGDLFVYPPKKGMFLASWSPAQVSRCLWQGLGSIPLFGCASKCQWLFEKSSASLSQISLSVSLGDSSLSPLHYVFIPETRRYVGCGVGWFSCGRFVPASCFSGAGSAPLPSEGLRGMLQWPGRARLLLKPVSWKG